MPRPRWTREKATPAPLAPPCARRTGARGRGGAGARAARGAQGLCAKQGPLLLTSDPSTQRGGAVGFQKMRPAPHSSAGLECSCVPSESPGVGGDGAPRAWAWCQMFSPFFLPPFITGEICGARAVTEIVACSRDGSARAVKDEAETEGDLKMQDMLDGLRQALEQCRWEEMDARDLWRVRCMFRILAARVHSATPPAAFAKQTARLANASALRNARAVSRRPPHHCCSVPPDRWHFRVAGAARAGSPHPLPRDNPGAPAVLATTRALRMQRRRRRAKAAWEGECLPRAKQAPSRTRT
jgi:hypothetical protein